MVANIQETGESSASSERSKKNKKKLQYDCEVKCLDGTVIKADVEKSDKGEEILKKVVSDLNLKSKEYVGLLFQIDGKNWLDIHKDMKHQLGDSKAEFYFRVKFYEPEPSKLQDEYMRYLLYLQVREDLREKRLVCSNEITARLGGYTAQAELGDFNLSEHDHHYLDGYEFSDNEEVLLKVNQYHKEFRGQTPAECEVNFLEIAKKIPRYGIDIHNAMDAEGPVEIGIAPLGINVYRNGEREHLFRWQMMRDFLYSRRKFTVKLKEPVTENDSKKTFVYYFESAKLCKQCYKAAVEYHTFFRLTRPDAPRKRVDSLKLGSSFRYSDRTLYQLRHSSLNEGQRDAPKFQRRPSSRRSLPASYKLPELVEPEVPYVDPNGAQKVQEEPIQYEEIEIDEENPDDDKYDPNEWETIEKTLPDGTKKRYRRRIITVVKIVPQKQVADEEPVEYEEVEIDEANPDDDKYDPKEWETVEKEQPDGSKKRFRRRIVIIKVVKKPEELVNENEVQVEEMQINESSSADDGKYDPEEWETVEKLDDDGNVKRYRRRIAIVKIIRKSDEEPVNEEDCKVEEVEYDEANPQDELYDPDEWETIERPRSDGTVKKYRRRLYIIKIVKKPSPENEDGVNYEEEEITEDSSSDPEKYDPEEWEELVKTQPDGSIKRYRRRIIVVKVVKETEDGERKPIMADEPPIEYEEVEIDEDSPEFESALDDPEYEIVQKRKPDGTIVRVKRRIIKVVVVKRPGGEKSPVEEEPVEYEEVELDENSQELIEALDDPEYDVIEKKKPDGTIIRVKRRAMKVTVRKPVRVTITTHPIIKPSKKEPVDEEDLSYEEIEVDENSPVHYDKNIWEEFEKVQPDGSVKKFRRRFISKCNVILKKPSIEKSDDVKYEEVEFDENDKSYDPENWEIIEKEQPDGTKKRFRRRIITTTITTTYTTTRYIVNTDGEEQTVMETKPVETTQTITFIDGKPVGTIGEMEDGSLSPLETTSMSMDDLISEINEMSLSLDQPAISSNRKPVVESELIKGEISVPVESAVVEETPSIDSEELKRRKEAERLEQEGLNATIDSIFTLPSDEEVKTPLRDSVYEYDEAAYNETFDHELDEYGIDLQLEENPQIDGVDFELPDPTKPKVKPKKAPKPQRKTSSNLSESETYDNTEEKKSTARDEQSDYRPLSGHGQSEIIYTVTDVSQVEQGRGGFVSAVRAKHEHLAHEPVNCSPRSSSVFESPPQIPKGHVPTRTVSFNQNDKADIVRTNDPPSVPAEPTVIIPDESELPEEEIIFKTNQSQEESHPDMEQIIIEATDIPEVETEVVIIKELQEDDSNVAPRGSEPGVVRTRPFILPRQDTQVIKTEIIEVDLTPSHHMDSFTEEEDPRELSISTEQLPTEVITKTITIEGDSTELTAEEIEKLLKQAPEQVGDLENFTSTQVVRTTTVQKTITGKTITVTGDADEEEMQRMLNEAVSSDMSQTTTTDKDGNIIITAVRDEIIVDDDKDDSFDGTEI